MSKKLDATLKKIEALVLDALAETMIVPDVPQPWTSEQLPINFEERVETIKQAHLALAVTTSAVKPLLNAIEAAIRPLQDAIDEAKRDVNDHEEILRVDALTWFNVTGDNKPVDGVSVARRSKWMYDKDAALDYARDNAPDCVRVKESLDVRSFEKLIDSNEWSGAERVNQPVVTIKLKFD